MKRPSDALRVVPASLPPPLPPLSTVHKQVVGALIDTFFPPLPKPPPLRPATDTTIDGPSHYISLDELDHDSDEDPTALHRYWAHALSSDLAYLDAVEAAVQRLPRKDGVLFRKVLDMLSSALGTSLLSGSFHTQSFATLPWQSRVDVLQAMLQRGGGGGGGAQNKPSFFADQRSAAVASLKKLLCGVALSYTVAGNNPFWAAMHYPGPPQLSPSYAGDDTGRTVAAMAQQRWMNAALLTELPSAARTTLSEGDSSSKSSTSDNSAAISVLECDILVIGSGAGAGVAAAECAKAGYSTLIVEKGDYVSPAQVSNLESDALDQMYESHGMLTTTNSALTVLAGATLGGGTTINWSCCLPLPDYIRREWASGPYGIDYVMPGHSSDEYESALHHVLSKLGALDRVKPSHHNPANQLLQRGCDAMGYAWEPTGQNLRDPSDPTAGFVCFGDRYHHKNGGVSVFLREAAKHGAKILPNCRITHVTIEEETERRPESSPPAATASAPSEGESSAPALAAPRHQRPRATGAEGHLLVGENGYGPGQQQPVRFVARKAVIVAAGALHTPCLLRASGLGNAHIGRHLRLHPVTTLVGLVRGTQEQPQQQKPVHPYLGAPMTTVCHEFASGPKGDGYGARIEVPSGHPGLAAAALGWNDPIAYKDRIRQFRHSVPLVVLQRDTSEGTVQLAPDGSTVLIDYRINDDDRRSMLQAVKGGLQVLITGGAQLVTTSHVNDPGLILDQEGRPSSNSAGSGGRGWSNALFHMASDEQVQAYLSFVALQGLQDHQVGLFSAHQMGTCRMSASPAHGAIDMNGETWDCDNLYVMDGSTFPTASGVNPMVTIMVVAKILSTRLALRLRLDDKDRTPLGALEAERAAQLESGRQTLRSRHPSYSLRRPSVLSSLRERLPRRRLVLQLLAAVAVLLLAVGLAAWMRTPRAGASPLMAAAAKPSLPTKLSAPSAPAVPPRGSAPLPDTDATWMEQLSKTWSSLNFSSLLPTSVMWTLLLFPFF